MSILKTIKWTIEISLITQGRCVSGFSGSYLSWVLRDPMPMVEAGHCVLGLHLSSQEREEAMVL